MKLILVVDNEAYIREVAQICLETVGGWQVITAHSGQEGLELAAEHQPHAILLDVMMPHMDGLETFKQLQADPKTQSIPVILLTAKMQATDRLRYTGLGIAATIAKPFDPLELPTQIAQILGWEDSGNA